MIQYMLLFSLGPVQSFIVQARKTRDLWLGSFLLSALMQESMEGIDSLIFPVKPFIDKEKRIPDLPNKYIAVFDKPEDAVDAAIKSEQRINTFWRTICKEVWNEVLANVASSTKETHQQWNNQIEPAHLFEIFWVVVEGDSKNYRQWLKETQQAFEERKYLRDFQQQKESGEKSTISGLRSALRGPEEQRSDVQKFWKQVAAKRSARDIDKDGAERLDAIDTVKRFAFFSHSFRKKFAIPHHESGLSFPSTSSIAVAPFLERLILASNDLLTSLVIKDWLREGQKLAAPVSLTIPLLTTLADQDERAKSILTLDGDCLFPETFNAKRLESEFGIEPAEKCNRLARSGPEALAALFRVTDKRTPPITRPTPYYAMIQMDGDRMGRLINGVQEKVEHQDINSALSEFSRDHVPALVEGNYLGRLVYAGGDDVFALAPLARDLPAKDGEVHQIRTVLDLVNQLQQRYCDLVKPKVIDHDAQSTEPNAKTRKESVTASTGIAIAHHYTSLSYVRRVSKEAEQLAKEHYGRNALVVTVLRRSGEQTRVGCHWHYPDLAAHAQPIPLFLTFYTLFKDDILSPKCVFNLLEEAPTLVVLSQDAQVSEVKRVLLRQRNPALEGSLPDNEILQKAQSLIALAEAMDKDEDPHINKEQKPSVELHSSSRRYGLVEVLGWLLVMLFLARKEQE